MNKENKIELMESFEAIAFQAKLDLDLTTKNVEYTDKLTVICYHFYVEGINLNNKILTKIGRASCRERV